jgi:hypothetical protein
MRVQKVLPSTKVYISGEDDRFTRLKVLVIGYGGPKNKDFYGDYFTPKTDFGDKYVRTLKAYYDHHDSDNPHMTKDEQLIGRATFVEETEEGRWYLFEIDKAHRYHNAILELARKGWLGASTQAYPASVRRLSDGFLATWHESEASLTVQPANYDTVGRVYEVAEPYCLTVKSFKDIDLSVTKGMVEAAERALRWRDELGRGGTEVGIETARQITTRGRLTPERWVRMYSFFSRHEVDKQAQGFYADQPGFPSNGRIAWDLWGGDPGYARSTLIRNRLRGQE